MANYFEVCKEAQMPMLIRRGVGKKIKGMENSLKTLSAAVVKIIISTAYKISESFAVTKLSLPDESNSVNIPKLTACQLEP